MSLTSGCGSRGLQRYVFVLDQSDNYWSSVDGELKKLEGEEAELRNE